VVSGTKGSGDVQDERYAVVSGTKGSGDVQDEWYAVVSGMKGSGDAQNKPQAAVPGGKQRQRYASLFTLELTALIPVWPVIRIGNIITHFEK